MMATLSIMTHSDLREERTEMFLVIIRKTNIGNVGVGGSTTVNIIDTTGSLECTLHTRQCMYAPNLTHFPTTTIIPSLSSVLYHVRFVNDLYSVQEGEKAVVQLCIEDPMVKQCVERESDHEAFRVNVLASNGTAVGGHAGTYVNRHLRMYNARAFSKGRVQVSGRLAAYSEQLLQRTSYPSLPHLRW